MSDREAKQAARYEQRYPNTGVAPSVAAERMDRLDVRERDYGSRSRIFLMPELPWHRKERENA